MPRQPTIIADANINTGPVGPYASPIAFSDGAQGLDELGQGVSNLGGSVAQIAAKKQRDDDARWSSKATAQYDAEAINFLHDPANANREDYAVIADKFLNHQKADYLQRAPSNRARQIFTQHADGFTNRNRASILERGERVKLENTKNELETTVNDLMRAFRQTASPSIAESNAEVQRVDQHRAIEAIYADLAPATKRGLHEYIDNQFIIGVAEQNPSYARSILDGSNYIDQSRRKVLLNHIEEVEQRGIRLAQFNFQEQLDLRLGFAADNTKLVPDESLNSFVAVYGTERGQLEYAQWKKKQTAINQSVTAITRMEGANPPAIAAEIEKLQADTSVHSQVRATAKQHAKILVEQQAEDAAEYLTNHNPEVHSAFTTFAANQDAQSHEQYLDLLWRYQGAAPENVSPEEARKYLNLEGHYKHLLRKSEAIERAATLRKGQPSEQLNALLEMEAQYPNKRHWARVYQDLVSLPPQGQGIPQEMQLGFLIDDPTHQKQFMVAISNFEGLKGLNEDSKGDFLEKLRSNTTWQRFSRAMVQDMAGGANEVEGYQDGIIKYAYALSFGRNTKEAVNLAVQNVIENQMWYTEVNGQTLMIPRKREQVFGPNLPDRTTDEIFDLGRRLALSLRGLAPSDVKRTDDFGRPLFPTLPPLEGVETEQMLRDIITSRGYFVPEDDGQSVSLYVMGDNGNGFQLRDKRNQPFELYLDALPNYSKQVMSPMQWKTIEHKEQPQKTYNILEDIYPGAWGRGSKRTNWPVTAEFYFRQVQPQKPPFTMPRPGTPAILP